MREKERERERFGKKERERERENQIIGILSDKTLAEKLMYKLDYYIPIMKNKSIPYRLILFVEKWTLLVCNQKKFNKSTQSFRGN